MMTNTTTSFACQDQAHDASTIGHLLYEEPPKHTPKLPKDLGPFITPLSYQRIWVPSSSHYLLSYPSGSCWNQNESFNNIIWSRCPKTGFCSLVSVDIAVSLAVIAFNHGLEGLSPLFDQLLGSPPSAFTSNYIASSDAKQIKKAKQKAGCMSQRWRKSIRSTALMTEESHITREGVTYESGGF